MTSSISKAISATRFLIILGPVMIHCQTGFAVTPYRLFWGEMVGRITVPLFFIISGYLFFQHFDGTLNAYVEKFRKRLLTLIVPYLLWNLLAFLFYWSIGVAPADEFMNSFWVVSYHSGHSPADGPLWFLRSLILLLPFTPIMYMLNKQKCLSWISVVLYLLLFTNMGPFKQGTIIGFACFNLGAFLALQKIEDYKVVPPRYLNSSLFISILMIIFVVLAVIDWHLRYNGDVTWSVVHWTLLTIGGMVIMLLPSFLSESIINSLCMLGKTSFFIFCLHEPIIPFVRHFTEVVGNSDLGYSLTIIVDVLVCLIVYWVMSKVSPKTLALLNGGR